MSGRNQLYMNTSQLRQAGTKCNIILQNCLAIQLHKTRVIPCGPEGLGRNGDGGDYWMYDNGYLLFQVRSLKSSLGYHKLQVFGNYLKSNICLSTFSGVPRCEFQMLLESVAVGSHERASVRRLRLAGDTTRQRKSLCFGSVTKCLV